jgi:hypothetical protein
MEMAIVHFYLFLKQKKYSKKSALERNWQRTKIKINKIRVISTYPTLSISKN